MMNEEMFNDIKKTIENEAKDDLAEIRSWENIGRDYAVKKDGTPFADPVRALRDVAGIKEVYRKKAYGTTVIVLTNADWRTLEVDDSTLDRIERQIKKHIESTEKDYRFQQFLLSHLTEIFEQCDNAINALSAVCLTKYEREAEAKNNEEYIFDLADFFNDKIRDYITQTMSIEHYRWLMQQREQKAEQKTA